jgi:hypothetical protein
MAHVDPVLTGFMALLLGIGGRNFHHGVVA